MVLSLITDYCRRYRRCWSRLSKLIRDAPILNDYFLNVVVEFFVGKGDVLLKSELGHKKVKYFFVLAFRHGTFVPSTSFLAAQLASP